jgi:hypothetical protein
MLRPPGQAAVAKSATSASGQLVVETFTAGPPGASASISLKAPVATASCRWKVVPVKGSGVSVAVGLAVGLALGVIVGLAVGVAVRVAVRVAVEVGVNSAPESGQKSA